MPQIISARLIIKGKRVNRGAVYGLEVIGISRTSLQYRRILEERKLLVYARTTAIFNVMTEED